MSHIRSNHPSISSTEQTRKGISNQSSVPEKTVVTSDPVKACIEQTRWHHEYALHVQYIEVEDARVNCKKAVQLKDNPDVNFGMARVHYTDGDFDKVRVLERLIKMATRIRQNFGRLLLLVRALTDLIRNLRISA